MSSTQPFSASHVRPHRFDGLSIILHWTVAGAIAGTYALGLLREVAPRGAAREWVLMSHTSLGLCVIALALVRVAWRMTRATPKAEDKTNNVARLVQLVLYGAMVGVPIIGLGLMWAKGGAVSFFGLVELPALVPLNRSIGKALEEVHEVTAHALMALAGLHAGAALFHHYVLRDGVLASMLPRSKA